MFIFFSVYPFTCRPYSTYKNSQPKTRGNLALIVFRYGFKNCTRTGLDLYRQYDSLQRYGCTRSKKRIVIIYTHSALKLCVEVCRLPKPIGTIRQNKANVAKFFSTLVTIRTTSVVQLAKQSAKYSGLIFLFFMSCTFLREKYTRTKC